MLEGEDLEENKTHEEQGSGALASLSTELHGAAHSLRFAPGLR